MFDFDPLLKKHTCATKNAPFETVERIAMEISSSAVYSTGKVKAAVMRSICMDHWSPRAIKNCWHPHALQCQFGTSYVCSHCITRWLVQLPTWQQLLGIVATPTCAKGSAHHREFCTSSSTARISSANLKWVPSWNLRTWYQFRKRVSWHPRQNRKAKFDRWHPWKLRKLVPLRCRLLKGVHLDLSNSATKCNQSWAADFLPSSWRTRKNTLILLACNRINKKHTKTAKTASDFSHKTSIAWHPRHHESIGPLFNLTAKVEVQLPVYDLPKALGFASSIYIYIYTHTFWCPWKYVKMLELRIIVLQPDFHWLRFKSIILLTYVLAMSNAAARGITMHGMLRRLAGHTQNICPKSLCFLSTGHAIIQTT